MGSDSPSEPLIIRDTGHMSGCSVTNDAEAVVQHLHEQGLLNNGRRLLYFDSDDELSELLHDGPVFKGFKSCPL
jgi:hypothetical protein